jgi:uncharacterized phage protein (TIGR02220 family)
MAEILMELAKRADDEGFEISESGEVSYKTGGTLQNVRQLLDGKEISFVQNLTDNEAVKEIFLYWQAQMNSPQSRLTPERRQKIQARMEQGYSVEQIKKGIDGCGASAWHMGANDRQEKFNDLTLICRNGSQLEKFIAKASGGNGHVGAKGATPTPNKYANRR